MDRQTLSIMKACEVVGVSRRTIYNWISAGKVEYVRTAGGSIRIFADTLWRDGGPRNDVSRRDAAEAADATRESLVRTCMTRGADPAGDERRTCACCSTS